MSAVTYLDQGYGRLSVTAKTADGQEIKPDKFTQLVLTDSGEWVTSYERVQRHFPRAEFPRSICA